MKQFGQLIVISLMAIIFIPAVITITFGNHQLVGTHTSMTQITQKEQANKEKDQMREQQLIGMIAKAIPISYEAEILKVHAIMARSHMALVEGDASKVQAIPTMSVAEMKELWGSDYGKNYAKMKKAVEDTQGIIVTYENQPIQLVYHLQSAGDTQSSLDIWDIEVPYLQSVESLDDQKAPDLITKKEYSSQEIIKKVNQHYNTTVLEPYALETQMQIIERTQGGYVKSIQVGNQLMRGDDFRKLLNLRSGNFICQYDGEYMSVVTKGAGHGVGLSQYGANEMAKRGESYGEILSHYFPDTTLVSE